MRQVPTVVILTISLALSILTCICLLFFVFKKLESSPFQTSNMTVKNTNVLSLQYGMQQSVIAPCIKDAFIIHMSKRTDRLVHIEKLKECLKPIVSLKVFEASDGGDMVNPACKNLKKGEIGCLSSHLKILQSVSENTVYTAMENNWVLIFEDDVILQIPSTEIKKRILQALHVMPLTTAIVYFGFGNVLAKNIVQIGKYAYLGEAAHGTHAYAVRAIHAYKLAKLCMDNVVCKPIDALFTHGIKNAGFVYARKDRQTVSEGNYWGHGVFGQDLSINSNIQNKTHVESLSTINSATYV